MEGGLDDGGTEGGQETDGAAAGGTTGRDTLIDCPTDCPIDCPIDSKAGQDHFAVTMQRIHATCISLLGLGILLRGPSGVGKSDLALRLIDAGAMLVADDQVLLDPRDGRLTARAPAPLAGLLEVRGVGILPLPSSPAVPVALLADCVPPGRVERLPAPDRVMLAGVTLPRIMLAPLEASAPAKLRLALAAQAAGLPPVPPSFDTIPPCLVDTA